jgi:hypothetical protein
MNNIRIFNDIFNDFAFKKAVHDFILKIEP